MSNQGHKHALHLGDFDSERFWRDTELARLPGIPDKQAERIVSVMDELLFSACDRYACAGPNSQARDDVLITRRPMQAAHKEYLWEIGFRFRNNEKPVIAPQSHLYHEAVCALLPEHAEESYFSSLLADSAWAAFYSVLPTTQRLCEHFAIPSTIPNVDAVIRANSKCYSHRLAADLLGERYGVLAHSARGLETQGRRLLATTPFLVKDAFGVSGKGNVSIDSPRLLERITRYLIEQENKGKQTRFLLEPLLDKVLDFSCQLYIHPEGAADIVSVQQMHNAGFAFAAIETADQAFMEQLEGSGYLNHMESVAARLYREGYFGPVCVDSMLLEDGGIRAMVEINARESMGFINHYVDHFLQQFGKQGSLEFFSLGLPWDIGFEEVLERMRQTGILFEQNNPEGVLPLSANTLTINRPDETGDRDAPADTLYKGRLYVSIVASDMARRLDLKQRLQAVFRKLGIRDYH
uniref:ATP-grasp domain-containing protein n=1 Tax=Candidatus Kentrum sp. UNK TaxID=2126344 RepID=A0A451ABR6_9GAMM|nr:MAG: hypothetical protein BECKUNK1418G_GA0071005_10343 [Candidatus Kentron sp. UNK]VFK70825.1 MAG: hypothetical protein BECKUNK1418H_GA0071006_10404 [Candidatus Kentron sp. UNK]